MRAKIQDTYNIQVVEQRSHSFAFCFPPEGDFAPEAHHTPTPPKKLPHQTKKTNKKKPKTQQRLEDLDFKNSSSYRKGSCCK